MTSTLASSIPGLDEQTDVAVETRLIPPYNLILLDDDDQAARQPATSKQK